MRPRLFDRANIGGRVALGLAAVLAAAALWLTGATAQFENALRNAFFAVQPGEASGQLVLVEMDAASIASIDRWPWPRGHYANVIAQLDAAGARSIVFDVDFSSPSIPSEDARLAAAIAGTDAQIVLPTFAQKAEFGGQRMLDSLPIPELRENATLASVAILPDADGLVRTMPMGSMTAGMPRPSLAAQIAQRHGTAGQHFPLDLAIDPATIPRLSFIAVEHGRFAPADVAGKDVLIGGTGIEMGDFYAVSRFGVLPGPVVQALAAETLYKGVPMTAGAVLPLLLCIPFLVLIAGAPDKRRAVAHGVGGLCALALLHLLAWIAGRMLFDIAPAILAVAIVTGFGMARLLRAEMQARRMHDPRTGLPNRLAMVQARDGDCHFTIAAKIGGFERLHTVLGDDQAAELVRRLAERLAIGNGAKRVYHMEDRILAWSSDALDFDLEQMLGGLHAVMRSPVEIAGRRVDVQMAFGIAEAGAISEATHSASEALRAGERWRYHVAAERAALERQVSLMGELDAAIGRKELEVLYQPKLHLPSERITSVEALVRWKHPERGYLRPDLFIPLAEESDRITDLTLYVLQQAIADLQQWCAHGLVLHAAVNVSAQLLASESFMSSAEDLLRKTGVPRQRLIFEVTESAAISDPAVAAAALGRFRELGVAISVDDYGTGQSTLSYLKRLPLSELKIDRSFVQYAHRDQGDASLVRSTVNLAHELGLSVVAEGVEEPECLAFLREVGCDYAQGYLISKPVSAQQLEDIVMGAVSEAA